MQQMKLAPPTDRDRLGDAEMQNVDAPSTASATNLLLQKIIQNQERMMANQSQFIGEMRARVQKLEQDQKSIFRDLSGAVHVQTRLDQGEMESPMDSGKSVTSHPLNMWGTTPHAGRSASKGPSSRRGLETLSVHSSQAHDIFH